MSDIKEMIDQAEKAFEGTDGNKQQYLLFGCEMIGDNLNVSVVANASPVLAAMLIEHIAKNFNSADVAFCLKQLQEDKNITNMETEGNA